ncbi:MAG TPA: GNAT family N-acetyltransferase [Oculatellaceae cyanobacterium]
MFTRSLEESTSLNQSNLQLSLEIVSCHEAAAKLVMRWRNDNETLANSFDSTPKEWPEFFQEFSSKYFVDSSLPCLFLLKEGKRVGFIRFRRLPSLVASKSACDISVNMAPDERGHGLARKFIELSLQIPRNAGIDAVIAEIKSENIASKKTFQNAGFRFECNAEHVLPDGSKTPVQRFIRETCRSAELPNGRGIGNGHACFIIAEAGSNWRMGTPARDLKMARALIDVAAEAGADAVKFQTYKPATTYVANAGQSDYLSDSGIKESISDIFADLSMPYEMLPELAEYAAKQNILFMSSPFSLGDFEAVDRFVSVHKIASYEISHSRLIEAAARSNKVTVLSTGASDIPDIEWAVDHFQERSNNTLCLMQCTARYPAPLSSLNLRTIPALKAKFGLPVGLSDHTRDPIAGPLAAVALGANLIEKHYTLDNRLPGPDHAFAITVGELKEMVDAIRKAEQVVGSGAKIVQPEEEELFWYARRGLQAVAAIAPGEKLVEGTNFEILRPGKQKRGIHPKFIDQVQGKASRREIAPGDGLQIGDF